MRRNKPRVGEVMGKDGSITMSREQLLDEMRHLCESQEETAQKLKKGARRDPYLFYRKGNENQFQFCENVKESIAVASPELKREQENPVLEKAKASFKKGMNLLNHRQKLIKIADRSESGWAVRGRIR